KPRYADQHHLFARESPPHRKISSLLLSIEVDDGMRGNLHPVLRRYNCRAQFIHRNIKMPRKRLRRSAAIGHVLPEWSEGPAWTDYRIEEPSRCSTITEFETISNDLPHAQVLCQRTHQVIERLAHKDHICARLY